MTGRPSFTRDELKTMGRHIAAFRVAFIVRAAVLIATLAAAYLESWHWLVWGGLFVWFLGKASPPPDPELDRITGR